MPDTRQRDYQVVRIEQGKLSIWPADLAIADDRRRLCFDGVQIDHRIIIQREWTDLRLVSLRLMAGN